MPENPVMRARIDLKSGGTLAVRTLRAGDGPRLQRFNSSLSEQTRGLFLPHAYDAAAIARIIERAESGVDLTYVAFTGEEIAAYFFLWDFHDPIPLLGIGITDIYQGQDIGRQLLQILIDDARRAERDGIDLTTMLTNDRAFALYRKMGFQYLADVDNIAGDGRVVTERWMFLPLKPGAQPRQRQHRPPE